MLPWYRPGSRILNTIWPPCGKIAASAGRRGTPPGDAGCGPCGRSQAVPPGNVYRTSPYEVQFYGADRWESSPADMVGNALLDRLRRSGLFRRVVPWRHGEADERLEVRLGRFEEVDEADAWYGAVELEYEVVDGDGKSLLRG